jgi:phenylpropionate dioxygenase-like ring-hydroxylating dioxygenase large terminal subunit
LLVARIGPLARAAPRARVALAGGLPVVLTRDRDDILRAFANVCRHRGAIVAEGAGERGTLQCPYHAWTYGLDGCLRAAPRTAGDPDFDAAGLGLVPMAVVTWGPFVFVNPDPAAGPLSDALGDLPDLVREHGVDVDALRFHHRVEYEIQANWKIAIENYLECYHCRLNHPGLVSVIDGPPPGDGGGRAAGEPVQPGAPGPRRGRRPRPGPVPPAVPVAQGQRRARPGGEPLDRAGLARRARCRGFLDYFFAPGAPEDWIAEFLAFDDQVGAEDTALVEAAQRGAASGLVDNGRLLAHDEQLIAHFQAYVRERLT